VYHPFSLPTTNKSIKQKEEKKVEEKKKKKQ
jgi:hypothetical protein